MKQSDIELKISEYADSERAYKKTEEGYKKKEEELSNLEEAMLKEGHELVIKQHDLKESVSDYITEQKKVLTSAEEALAKEDISEAYFLTYGKRMPGEERIKIEKDNHTIYGIDEDSGKTVWEHKTHSAYHFKMRGKFPEEPQFKEIGNSILVADDYELILLNKSTGDKKARPDRSSRCDPIHNVQIGDGEVYVSSPHKIEKYTFDENGITPEWNKEIDGPLDIAIGEQEIYVASFRGLFKIDKESGNEKKIKRDEYSKLALAEDGTLYAARFMSGDIDIFENGKRKKKVKINSDGSRFDHNKVLTMDAKNDMMVAGTYNGDVYIFSTDLELQQTMHRFDTAISNVQIDGDLLKVHTFGWDERGEDYTIDMKTMKIMEERK